MANYYKTDDRLKAELAKIDRQTKELQARADLLRKRDASREKLLTELKKNGFDRDDVRWIYAQMAPTIITRKMRLKRLAEANRAVEPAKRQHRNRDKPQHQIKPELVPFGKALQKAREDKELNRTDFARKIGCNNSMIGFWERGCYIPSPPRMAAIQKVLETDFSPLIPERAHG